MSDEELVRRLPELHVFGRVSPEDKLRLARAMQREGLIVAMTGDAVNDAAALKQADIGVAMGSGSEVTKQAGRMILTDDNFGTLVHAVEIGRRVYEKIVSYVRFQMTQLLAPGHPLRRGLGLQRQQRRGPDAVDGALPAVLRHRGRAWWSLPWTPAIPTSCIGRPVTPRCPSPTGSPCCRGSCTPACSSWPPSSRSWPGPTRQHPTTPSASLTMTFVVMGLGTVFNALTNRRDPASGLDPPIFKAAVISLFPVVMLVLATQLPSLQSGLLTQSLTRTGVAGLHRAGPAPAAGGRGDEVDTAPAPAGAQGHFAWPSGHGREGRSAG